MLKFVVRCAGTRDSKAALLKGKTGWVEHRENGILYCLDVTRCMFSSGNVTEKARMGRLACCGEIVVDLFAGIGYYTLPLLVHAGGLLCCLTVQSLAHGPSAGDRELLILLCIYALIL